MEVRVGVVGTGVMGADHVRTLASSVPRAVVSAVADVDLDRARAAVAGVSGVRVLEDPFALVKDADVDAVLVASADRTHEELVLACLGAGKPVLCEKPLTPTPDGALRIVAEEASLRRRLVTVGFMRRYDPGFAELAAGLAAGVVGTPLLLHCVHRNASSGPGARSTGLITGSAVHEIDIARWLLGAEIARVTVHLPRPSPRAPDGMRDPLVLVLETTGGVLVDVEVFVNCQYGYDVRCELVGESGSLELDRPALATRRSAAGRSETVAADWRDRFADAYRLELTDWVAGVLAGEQRGPTTWDGYAATAVAAAGVRAFETGEPAAADLEPRPALYDR